MTIPTANAPNNLWYTRFAWLHQTLFALFIGSILAYGTGFAWYMLVRFDLVNIIRDVNADDSFYYFQIARNLAAGKFSTFDGGITLTNGYHPLWMLLITPFYWIFDKETALFVIKAFEIMLIAAGIALIAGAARLARLPWILLFALPPVLYLNLDLFLGLEAAVALFMLGLFFLNQCLYARNPGRWKWSLAAAAFALPWARLEYVAISLATAAALCLIERSRLERSFSTSWKESIRSITALPAVTPLCGACAGILLYFAYNWLIFGGIVPVSGAVKQAWSQWDWEREGGYSLTQNFLDVLRDPVFDDDIWIAMEVGAYVLLVWWFARHSRSRRDRLLLSFLVCVFGLAAGHLAKFAQIVLTMTPTMGIYGWYFVPAFLMMTLIVPIRCYVAIYFIRRFIEPRSSLTARILNLGSVLVCAVFLLMEADFTKPFRYVSSISKNLYQEWEIASYMGVQIMNRVLPEGNVIGSWDSGVIGYFSRFPVVNLDGLTNSYDYFRTMTSERRKMYFFQKEVFKPVHQEFGITYLANADVHPLANTLYEGMSFSARSFAGFQQNFKLASVEPLGDVDTNAWFWKRMAPYFDFRSGDVRVVVDGRLAQAFAQDCTPGEWLIWVWGEQGDAHLSQPWTRSQTGLCAAAFVLPRNAFPPVRFETMLARDRKAALRSNFDVSLTGNGLLYEKHPCSEEDTKARFFLHLLPVDVNSLPDHRRQYNFDNLDFDWDGPIVGGTCRAKVPLPDYDIAHIRTGQYVRGEGHIWAGGFDVMERMHDRYSTTDPSSNQWRFGSSLYLVGEQFIGQFEDGLDGWLLEGEAVTNQISQRYKGQGPISGSEGRGFLTTYHPDTGDVATGQARSPVFIPESDHYLVFLIAGGGGTGVGLSLWADGEEIKVWRGDFTEDFKLIVHPLAEVAGRRLHLEMFDDETGGWGHIMLDHVMLARRNVDDLQ